MIKEAWAGVSEQTKDVVCATESVLIENKATDVKVYRCHKDYFADFVIVATGGSSRHMAGLCERVRQMTKSKFSIVPGVDGGGISQNWIAMDLGPVVLHVLHWEARHTYDIDTLMLEFGGEMCVSEALP